MAAGGAIPAFESTAISLSRLSLRVPELMTRQTDLARWPIFSILPEDVVNSIRKICVFGSSGNEAIFITASDDVYAIGSNCSSCLGLGDTHSSFEPRKINALCRKGITDIAFGSGPHVLVVTADGDLFSWGHNGYCQLGNGSSNQGIQPVSISQYISHQVVRVACGSHHSLALTKDGEIYGWGQNNCGQVGNGTTANQPTPRKVTAVLGNRQVISISCGQTSSVALLDSGEVYGWGYNGNGQLGLGNNVNQPSPCRVHTLQGIIISQLVCGYAHTLALSDEGVLFSWGANSYGQLGTGNKANLISPTKVTSTQERFIEVAATHYSHVSAAMTQTGKILMWGQCRGQSITAPIPTRFSCIDDVFAAFSAPPVTWRVYCIDQVKGTKVAESVAMAFDDAETSDLRFVVESQEIHVHKSILKIRCEHFRSMFQSFWTEDEKDCIEITQYPYAVYKAFLHYLYTDTVNLRPEEAIGLLDLANAYCEERLKQKCEEIICQGISVDNVAMLYAAAIKFEAKTDCLWQGLGSGDALGLLTFLGKNSVNVMQGSGGVLLPLCAEPSDRCDPDGGLLQTGRLRHEGVHSQGCFIRGFPLLSAAAAKGEHPPEGAQVLPTEDAGRPFRAKALARLSLLLLLLLLVKCGASFVPGFAGRK